MKRQEFEEIEAYMKRRMCDSAHDVQHIYRVLYAALDIAGHEENVDCDVLLAAALLHDIGREAQFKDPTVCHAEVGAKMAYAYLLGRGWKVEKAAQVYDCIDTHRYRGDNEPESIEAKILFDADKLDTAGAMGIARTLIYEGQVGESLYQLDANGDIVRQYFGEDENSFFQEYNYKLKKIYDRFYTARGKAIAHLRRRTAVDFYNSLYSEITDTRRSGAERVESLLA